MHKGMVYYPVVFSPDGRYVLLGAEKKVHLWELVAKNSDKK